MSAASLNRTALRWSSSAPCVPFTPIQIKSYSNIAMLFHITPNPFVTTECTIYVQCCVTSSCYSGPEHYESFDRLPSTATTVLYAELPSAHQASEQWIVWCSHGLDCTPDWTAALQEPPLGQCICSSMQGRKHQGHGETFKKKARLWKWTWPLDKGS